MALFDRETDPEKERNGVPLDFGDYRVTLARIGGANDRFEIELERELKPHRRVIAVAKFDKEKEREIVFRVFARTVVMKWETLTSSLRKLEPGEKDSFVEGIDMRGKLVPASEDNIVAVFKAMHGVFLDLQSVAKGEQLFRLDQREDDAGN